MLQKINFKKLLTAELISVFTILTVAFLLRVYRVGDILAFHYDQGRDALVIWDLIYEPHKFFLIGPTTGLAGIFRGPFYYYLIAPFYWLGGGNPVYPSVFLAILTTAALYLMYLIGKEMGGRFTGFIALLLGTFSFEIIYASRWLSNPTPMLFLSMLLIYCMFRIYERKNYYWILLSLVLGLSFFSFGSSGELFYFPAVLIFGVWQIFRRINGKLNLLTTRQIVLSVSVFFLTFLPLLVFNLKHGNILVENIKSQISDGRSFTIPTWQFMYDRVRLLGDYFGALIYHGQAAKEQLHLLIFLFIFIPFIPLVLKNDKFKIVFLPLVTVFAGLMFYAGNFGNLYAYYLTGYYLIFLLMISYLLKKLYEKSFWGKVIVSYFIIFFMLQNWSWVKPYINSNGENPNTIIISNQLQSIDWIYDNSKGREFNVDFYVPPVIPYSYNYLVKWHGNSKDLKLPTDDHVPLLYTLYEDNPDNPDRLEAWLARQEGIGSIIKEESFGGITVQERIRIQQ